MQGWSRRAIEGRTGTGHAQLVSSTCQLLQPHRFSASQALELGADVCQRICQAGGCRARSVCTSGIGRSFLVTFLWQVLGGYVLSIGCQAGGHGPGSCMRSCLRRLAGAGRAAAAARPGGCDGSMPHVCCCLLRSLLELGHLAHARLRRLPPCCKQARSGPCLLSSAWPPVWCGLCCGCMWDGWEASMQPCQSSWPPVTGYQPTCRQCS